MITASKCLVNLMDPDPDTILIEDIAHGLANNCRWNGHSQKFWSVAQHCCMMFDKAPYNQRLSYLFHDAEEAYWGDMIRPLKNVIREKCPEIIELMKSMRTLIYKKFRISALTTDAMIADFECLEWEFEHIIKNTDADFWLPEQAENEWLKRYFKAVS
jgi:5'-deoxynucleotidase YfbR-like HD superfamily hydrolase